MAVKKKKASSSSYSWTRGVASTEGSPIIVADVATFTKRAGNSEGPAAYVDIDDGAVLLDTEGGGPADVGVSDDDLIVLLVPADAKTYAKLVKELEASKHDEYLVGTVDLGGELVIDDAANDAKPAFKLVRPAGKYVVVEGEIHDGEARWCRLVPYVAGLEKKYPKRPVEPARDPLADELARISFESAIHEARALEAALRIVDLGRPDLALEICAKASPSRRALANWTRVLALTAQKTGAASREASALATTLAEEWLRPADSAEHANQMLPRAHVLRALDASNADAALRARVVSAPEPDVFVADMGGDFF